MNLRSYRTFQALILAGLGIYLLSETLEGGILLFVNQRFILLVVLAALSLILLAQLVLRERPAVPTEAGGENAVTPSDPQSREGWRLWLVALPLLVGLLVPERLPGSSALWSRGVAASAGLLANDAEAALAMQIPPQQRSVLDWIRVWYVKDNQRLSEGQPVDITGFVYRDSRLGENQFLVSRYVITGSAADAAALGLVVDWPQAAGLSNGQWVRVQGIIHSQIAAGQTLPAVTAQQVEAVPIPAQPYLYP